MNLSILRRKDSFLTTTYNKTIEDAIKFLKDIENDRNKDLMLFNGLASAGFYGNIEVFSTLLYHQTINCGTIKLGSGIYNHLLGRSDEIYEKFNQYKHVNHLNRKLIIRMLLGDSRIVIIPEYRRALVEYIKDCNIIRLCCD